MRNCLCISPQEFLNIYLAKESDFQKATLRIFHESDKQSYLEIEALKK